MELPVLDLARHITQKRTSGSKPVGWYVPIMWKDSRRMDVEKEETGSDSKPVLKMILPSVVETGKLSPLIL
jgi:hypothetical protein